MVDGAKRRVSSVCIPLLLIAATVWFVQGYWADISALKLSSPLWLLPMAAVTGCVIWTNGFLNRELYGGLGIALTFSEWFGLSAIGTAGNLVLPARAGALANALYLKKRHGFSYVRFVSSLSATYVITFWINSLIGLAAIAWVWAQTGQFSWLMSLFLGAVFASLSVVMLLRPRFPVVQNRLLMRIIEGLNAWDQIRKSRRIIAMVSLITGANAGLGTAMIWFEFQAVGMPISWGQAAILAIFAGFSSLLSITPGNLGVREAFSGFSSALIGVPVSVAVIVSIVERLVYFVVSMILCLTVSASLLRELRAEAAHDVLDRPPV